MVDREGEPTAHAEKLEQLGAGREFEPVALQRDRRGSGRGRLQREDHLGRLVHPQEMQPAAEPLGELVRVMRIRHALPHHVDLPVKIAADLAAEQVRHAHVEGAEQDRAAAFQPRAEIARAGRIDRAMRPAVDHAQLDHEGLFKREKVPPYVAPGRRPPEHGGEIFARVAALCRHAGHGDRRADGAQRPEDRLREHPVAPPQEMVTPARPRIAGRVAGGGNRRRRGGHAQINRRRQPGAAGPSYGRR